MLPMAVKTDLPKLWEFITQGDYPAAAVTMRMRLLSEAALLPRRRDPLTDRHKAAFLIGLYASTRHVGAVEAAKQVANLENPAIESGPGLAWSMVNGRFEDVLTRLIHDLRVGIDVGLAEVSICSPTPQAVIALSGLSGGKWVEEVYRFSVSTPGGRFGRGSYTENHISGLQIKALALFGAVEEETSTRIINTEGKGNIDE